MQRTALVTGSTSGIGLSIARALAKSGCQVMLNGLGDRDQNEDLAKSLSSEFGHDVVYNSADMTKPHEIELMIDECVGRLGSLDILVNNAGIQHTAPIEQFPIDKWDAIIAINLSSAFHTIRCSIQGMKDRGFGRIINIASVHGIVASVNKAAYVAAKHGLIGLTKVVALEAADANVTCNAICPGWVDTPLVRKQIEAIANDKNVSLDAATTLLLEEKQPSKQFVETEHIGELVLFLASDAAKGITGVSLPIDGGWTAR